MSPVLGQCVNLGWDGSPDPSETAQESRPTRRPPIDAALGSRFARTWPFLALLAIVMASTAQAVWWVFLVPIYQSPDEPAHLDYALGIHANKGLLLAQNTTFQRLPTDAHPYTEYLRVRSGLVQVAFNPGAKMPPGYGTPEFFEALDRDAPTDLTIERPCQLAAVYPFGYYALLAGWIEVVRCCKEGVVAMFFGARLFSVVLLAISLVLTYATTRMLHFKPWFALLVTACIGAFPLTSFVSSYVQPDNLSFTMVSLSFYLALRARARGLNAFSVVFLGVALGGLLVTKIHFWLCVTPAVLAMVVGELIATPAARRHWLRASVGLLLPSLLLGGVWLWTVWGTQNYLAPRERSLDRLTHVVRLTRQAVDDFYAGSSHVSFWGVFGWLDTPLIFENPRVTEAIAFVVQGATWILLGLTLLRIEQVASRLIRVARAGRAKTAVRIALSNPVINSYFLFTAFMLFLFVWTSNRFGAQGRNWFPLILPVFLVSLSYAPKALTLKPSRRALTGVLAAGLLVYGVVGNHYARASLRDRYYFAHADRPMISVPFTNDPTDRIDMTWQNGVGEGYGHDPYLIYELERPTLVYGIRLRFTATNAEGAPNRFQFFWKNGAQIFSEHERSVRYDVPSGREKTMVLWIDSDISHFRIDPNNGPCRIEIHEITLLQEPDANRAERLAARAARRRSTNH